MNLGGRLLNIFRKESLARTLLVQQSIGQPQATPVNYENLARVGYGKSAITYTCISKIAGSTRSFHWELYSKKNPKKPKELDKHPLLDLWNKPNPMTSTADFVENLIAFYCLDGNSYVEANRGATKGVPLELWNVRPDKMKVEPGPKGYPQAYVFSHNGVNQRWEVDFIKMRSDILHWKTFNPTNDWYGMAPLQAAMLALDQHLAGQQWNLALLQNSATPSGVLQVKVSDANPRGELTDEQYKRMRADYEANYSGVKNTGKPMIIEGGLTWTQMSHSPKDVDYGKGKELSATDICLVFGVPPELVGLGQKTFNNYREARLSFFEETVLPITDSAIQGINRWLAPVFGEDLCLDYDKDSIDILVWKREQKYISLAGANFLNQNEKREAAGYEPAEGWDVYVIGNQVGANPEDFAGGSGTDPGAGEDPNNPSGNDNPDGIDKPKPDEDPASEDPKDPGSDDESGDANEDTAKSINLLTPNEKRQSWRAQNARRKRLTASFNRDLNGDFKELVTKLKAVKGNPHDKKLTEFALLNVLSDFMPDLEKTLKRNIKYTLEDFGGAILGEGKAAFNVAFDVQTKANLKYDHYVKHYTETRSGAAIKSISETSQKKIRTIVGEWVQTAITDGDSTPELSKFIESEFEELTPSMATRIARTEVSLASNNGALEAVKSLQIPNMFKEWVTANDDRVRDGDHGGADHGVMNGAEVGLDEKFGVPPDSLMEGPGDTSAPADQLINCFHPDTLIKGYAIAGTRFEYVGPMLKIQTESGRVLTVTKNHPILSQKGFIPANQIHQGDYLLADVGQMESFSGEGDVNKKYEPTRIKNIFETLHKLGNSHTVHLIADYFHGDAGSGQGNIDVVFSHAKLLDWFKTARNNGGNFIFEQKHPELAALNGICGLNESFERDFLTTPSRPSPFHLPLHQNGVGFAGRPFDGLLFGLSAKLDALLCQISRDYASITSDHFTKFEDRNPSLVKGDKVKSVQVFNYSGHVYDLQSNSGLLIANGFVVSNCRCVLVYRSKN